MNVENKPNYSIIFPTPEDKELLNMAKGLIETYAKLGLMLEQPLENLEHLAADGKLALAVDPENDMVIGSIAYTFQWPDGKTELGGWAVEPSLVRHGIGISLLLAIAKQNGHEQVIAFANNNSSPIFEKLGAIKMDQALVHPDAFIPCQTCHCNKEGLTLGQLCVDNVYDLTPVIQKLMEE